MYCKSMLILRGRYFTLYYMLIINVYGSLNP